jgi:hypothetical protein
MGAKNSVGNAPVSAAGHAGAGETAIAGSPAESATAGAGAGGSTSTLPGMMDAGASAPGEMEMQPPTQAGAEAADCDLTGVWIARQITVSEAIGVSAFSNNWYYLELKQTGTSVEVTKHHDCGIEVVGAVTVTLPRPALEAQLTHNVQIGRKLTMAKDGSNCRLESQRFWSIRGADEMQYLPGGVRDSETSIRELATSLPLPTAAQPQGAIDPDGDGKLGLAFDITGLISGTRNSVQRDWTRWFTDTGYEIVPSTEWASDLNVRADFDNEESVLDPRDGLLSSGSTPKAGAKHALRLHFLGRDKMDPRVTAIVKPDPVDTCYAIQDALPAEELQ